jgi:large subunit ribosomal protein L22
MGKPKQTRVLGDHEAKAINAIVRISPQKLNLLAEMIRGKRVERARAELQFSPKRAASIVKKVLDSAIANAENNHGLDVDSLIVSEAFVGKRMVMKRFHPRARGRAGKIEKFFSQITVIVREVEEAGARKWRGSKRDAAKVQAGTAKSTAGHAAAAGAGE